MVRTVQGRLTDSAVERALVDHLSEANAAGSVGRFDGRALVEFWLRPLRNPNSYLMVSS